MIKKIKNVPVNEMNDFEFPVEENVVIMKRLWKLERKNRG